MSCFRRLGGTSYRPLPVRLCNACRGNRAVENFGLSPACVQGTMEAIRALDSRPPQRTGCGGMSSRETEGLLIDRTLQGWPDAFGDLVQPYLTSLNRFARMRLRSESEAEDVVQQAVLRAFSNLAQFRREASFRTWLSAIAVNEVSQLRRGRAVAPVRSLQESHAASLVDPSSSPHALFQQRERAARLHQALTRLPEKYRTMIHLRDLLELSVEETARLLSLTLAAVRTRHHRARKLLTRTLTIKRAA
jgi:RNA polymerase sigma-70 factor (ECF subfamily)